MALFRINIIFWTHVVNMAFHVNMDLVANVDSCRYSGSMSCYGFMSLIWHYVPIWDDWHQWVIQDLG
jgi:hypothetical protein